LFQLIGADVILVILHFMLRCQLPCYYWWHWWPCNGRGCPDKTWTNKTKNDKTWWTQR